MTTILELLGTFPGGATEDELLAAARERIGRYVSARQVRAEIQALGDGAIVEDGRIRLARRAEPQDPEREPSRSLRRFVALDLETVVRLTERTPDGERMPFQVAAVRFGPDETWVRKQPSFDAFLTLPEAWEARLERPDLRTEYEATKRDPADALLDLHGFLEGADVLVAYNGWKLDFPVLAEALTRELDAALPPDLALVDGYYLALAAWPIPPRQHRLTDLIARYPEIREKLDIDLDGLQPHDARSDAIMLADLMRMAAWWVAQWPVAWRDVFAVVGQRSTAWRFLLALAGIVPRSASLSARAVADALALALTDKPPLRLPPADSYEVDDGDDEPAIAPEINIATLRGAEAAGEVDMDVLVRAVRGEAAEARRQQREMLRRMRGWIADAKPALVEAPTGTGKSLAAWAAALEWLAADPHHRVVMSTYTKQLQNQLADDIWKLDQSGLVPGLIDEASLVKGAANRLSLVGLVRVLADLGHGDTPRGRGEVGEFLGDERFIELVLYLASRLAAESNAVEGWEVHSVDDVDVEPFFGDYLHRRPGGRFGLRLSTYLRFLSQAESGDYEVDDGGPALHTSSVAEALERYRIVITNHALLLRHLDDFPDPANTLLVIDEAHSLEAAVTASLSAHVDYAVMEERARELRAWIRPPDAADEETMRAHETLANSSDALEEWLRLEALPASALRAFESVARDPLHPDALRTVSVASPLDASNERRSNFAHTITRTSFLVGAVYRALRAHPPRVDGIEEDRRWALVRGFKDLDDTLDGIREDLVAIREAGPADPPGNRIVWADEQGAPTRDRRRYRFGVTRSPIEVAREPAYHGFLRSFGRLFFVSATLRVAGSWDYISERLGLDPERVDRHELPSPFRVGEQARLVCFTDFPSWVEQESGALQSVAQQVHGFLAEMAQGNRNGVMVLTTSRAAAAGIGDRLLSMRTALPEPYRIADARLSGNTRAVREFQVSGGVLVGTKGLWAGVDIADAERLRLVWINKLPFAPFGDPLMAARRELVRRRAEEAGAYDPDMVATERYYLPQAAMELRQAVGRLIRSRRHRGVIVISDRKLGLPGRLNGLYRRLLLGSLDPDLVPNAAGDYAENLFSMADGWREIWSFFEATPPLNLARAAELSTPEALEAHTQLPSVRAIRNLALSEAEVAAGGEDLVVERCTAIARLLGDDPSLELRKQQREAIAALVEGRDVLGVLPTGHGKSFIYQLPALALPGVTIVVSPLVSLMTDQALNLNRSIGGAVRALVAPMRESNSRTGKAEVQAQLEGRHLGIKLIYLSPERLCQAQFQAWIRRGVERGVVRRIAIDEAHTFVTWGEDFRPSFKRAERFLAELRAHPMRPLLLALTATATRSVRDGLRHAVFGLDGRNPSLCEVQTSPIRRDLALYRRTLSGSVATERMVEALIDEVGNEHAIVYTLTIKEAKRLYNALAEHLGEGQRDRVRLYHGQMTPTEKELVGNEFSNAPRAGEDGYRPMLIVATSAFGLGVDRRDVRTVVVASPPGDLAALYQQLGRAGRDGAGASGVMLANARNIRTLHFMNSLGLRASLVPAIAARIFDAASAGWIDAGALAAELAQHDATGGHLRAGNKDDERVLATYRGWVMRVLAELDHAGIFDDLGDFPETVSAELVDPALVPPESASVVAAVRAAIVDPRAVRVADLAMALAPSLPQEASDAPATWALLLDLHQLGLADVSQRPNQRTLTAVVQKRTTIDVDLSARLTGGRRDVELALLVDFFNSRRCVNEDFAAYFEAEGESVTCAPDRRCSACWEHASDGEPPPLLGVLSGAVSGRARRAPKPNPALMRRRAAVHLARLLRWKSKGYKPFFLYLALRGDDAYWKRGGERRPLWPELIESSAFGALPSITEEEVRATLEELRVAGVLAVTPYGAYQLARFAAQAEPERTAEVEVLA